MEKVYGVVMNNTEEFKWERNVSNRLARVELAQIELLEKVTNLATQISKAQMHRSELERDVAGSNIERLDSDLHEIIEKRENVAARLVSAQETEKLNLEMLDEMYAQREKRIRQERDAAIITKSKSEKLVDDSSQDIEKLSMGPNNKQTIVVMSPVEKTWKYIWDKIGPLVVTGAFLLLANAVWEFLKAKLNAP